jgi:glycosyltransferase involved in cell wall biosynthesis
VSRYTAEKTKALLSLESEPCAILPNPVQLTAFTGVLARSRARVVFSGTLIPKKGIIPLIDAWPSVVAGCRDADLHIYGKDGRTYDKQPMWAYLSSRMGDPAALGVHYHGHVPRPELLQALTSARVAVFPSFAEAFAIAPLEAMACGCPTVYSSLGSGPEAIEDGRDGILVNPREPAQIADAILRLLQDDDLAGRLSAAGYDRVRRDFSIERLLPMNEAMYADAIRSFAGSRSGLVATH